MEFYKTNEYYIGATIILFLSLGLLGLGFYWKKRVAHFYSIAGWELFSVYWLLQIPHFAFDVNDIINVSFCALSLPFFTYLSYHEYLSYKWNEDDKSLKFMRGSTFIAGTIYFVIDKIPQAAGALIYAVAWQTSALLQLIGWNVHPGEIVYTGKEVYVPVEGSSISIILACTAIEAIVIFIAAIYCTPSSSEKRIKALLYTVPTIWLGNLVRNFSIIYLVDSHALADVAYSLGVSEFELAHTYLGNGGSFGVLIILAFVVLKVMPEVYDNIIGLVDLTIREKRRDVRLKLKSLRGKTVDKSIEGAKVLSIPDTEPEFIDISTSSVNIFYPSQTIQTIQTSQTNQIIQKSSQSSYVKDVKDNDKKSIEDKGEKEGLYIYASLLSRVWTKEDIKNLLSRIDEVCKDRGLGNGFGKRLGNSVVSKWIIVNGIKGDALEYAIEKGAVVSQIDDILEFSEAK
ncbi:MAG: archaeosortase A [Thermoplasmata archaeon]